MAANLGGSGATSRCFDGSANKCYSATNKDGADNKKRPVLASILEQDARLGGLGASLCIGASVAFSYSAPMILPLAFEHWMADRAESIVRRSVVRPAMCRSP